MKTTLVLGLLLLLSSQVSQAENKSNWWDNVQGLQDHVKRCKGKTCTEPSHAAAREYLRSLTPETLVATGRQCAIEFKSVSTIEELLAARDGQLECFIQLYVLVGGLTNLTPVLREISNPDNPVLWRDLLQRSVLRGWSRDLPDSQRLVAFDALAKQFLDPQYPDVLRRKNGRWIVSLLANMEGKDRAHEVSRRVGELLATVTNLIHSPNTAQGVNDEALLVVFSCLSEDFTTGASTAPLFRHMLRNHRSYSEEYWMDLARKGVDDAALSNDEVESVIRAMRSEASDKNTRARLDRLLLKEMPKARGRL